MTLGAKHPWALGRPASEVWAEIWNDIGPRAETVMRTGEATWDEGLLLFLERNGYPEETYHTFSYSPLPDDPAMSAACCASSPRTPIGSIGERRLGTLRELASLLAAVRTEPDVLAAIEQGLATNQRDLPFAIVWLFDAETAAGSPCLDDRHYARTSHAAVPEIDHRRRGRRIIRSHGSSAVRRTSTIDDLGRYGALPSGAWDQPPHQALAVPIVQQGESRPAGMLLVGLNPFRPLAESYIGFVDLVASQIASGLASARAYEAERQRAEALAEIDQREDRILLQRQPRVPHAADADAGSTGRRDRLARDGASATG